MIQNNKILQMEPLHQQQWTLNTQRRNSAGWGDLISETEHFPFCVLSFVLLDQCYKGDLWEFLQHKVSAFIIQVFALNNQNCDKCLKFWYSNKLRMKCSTNKKFSIKRPTRSWDQVQVHSSWNLWTWERFTSSVLNLRPLI